MISDELKKAIRECLAKGASDDCTGCPYENETCCVDKMMRDALDVIEGMEVQLRAYHTADTFLAAHGWKWKEN